MANVLQAMVSTRMMNPIARRVRWPAGAGALVLAVLLMTRTGGAGQDNQGKYLAEVQRLERTLPDVVDRGAALYLLARRYVQLGDRERALSLLLECLSRGQGFEPDVPAFQSLQTDSRLAALTGQFRRDHPPVHHAHIAFSVPRPDLFPEGLAYDRGRQLFYLSSEYHHNIVKVDRGRHVADFIPPGRDRLAPVGGLRVDPIDHSLWAATDSAEFAHFDSTGRLLERFATADPGPHILNDLVVRAGDVYLTDTDAHCVYRFDRGTHALTQLRVHRPLFYPNGIALTPDDRHLFVADDLGVTLVDLDSGQSHDVDPGARNTLAGIDGLYWYMDGLVGVQYGTGAYRVVRWRLSDVAGNVRSSELLEYRSSLVSFPTTGALVGADFYFLANTGIGNLKDGRIVDRAKLEPVHVAVVPLR
jgi:sugar lactone lactonase YvrE